MDIRYTAAAHLLSVAVVMLLSPLLVRSGRQGKIFSISVGIITFTVVKSIVVDVGWELAAAAGALGSAAAGAMFMGFGVVFVRRLYRAISTDGGRKTLCAIAVILTACGRGLRMDWRLVPNPAVYSAGAACGLALLAVSALVMTDRQERACPGILFGFCVLCTFSVLLLRLFFRIACEQAGFVAAPMLALGGCCGLIVILSDALRNRPEISAGGLAAGFMLTYCIDCLTG